MEENLATNGGTQDANGNAEGMTKAEFDQAKHDGIAYETHRKALAQRAKLKEELDARNADLQRYQQKELEDQGKHQELINSLREDLAKTKQEKEKMENAYKLNVVGGQIQTHLATRGVKNPDKAWKYVVAAHREDLKTIEVDDSYNVNSDDLKRFGDKFLADNVDMGWVGPRSVNDIPPGSSKTYESKGEDVSKLTTDEILNKLKE